LGLRTPSSAASARMVISPEACRSASSTAAATTRSRLSCGVARGGAGSSNQTMAVPYQSVYAVHMSGQRTPMRLAEAGTTEARLAEAGAEAGVAGVGGGLAGVATA